MDQPERQRNPYAPPVTNVSDIADAAVANTPFFAVSLRKFAIMSVVTFGLYEFYWFYKHWSLVSRRHDRPIMPGARAFFAVLFCHAFMAEVRRFEYVGLPPNHLQAGLLTIGWILFTLTQRLPDPFWVLSIVAFVFLLPAQERANEINRLVEPGHDPNDRLTPLIF